MIQKIFKPTRGKVLGDRLMRTEAWTTNGMWLIANFLQPKFMSELIATGEIKEEQTEKIISEAQSGDIVEVFVTEELRVPYDIVALKLESKDKTLKVWVNVWYATLFLKQKYIRPSFFAKNPLSPIVVKSSDKVIGIIMPVRMSDL